jgi:hypothetical protein
MPKIHPPQTPSATVTQKDVRAKRLDERPLVTFSKGYTINIGDHQFVKVQVEASSYTNPTEQDLVDIKTTFEKLSEIVDSELEYQIKEAIPQ